MTAEQIQNLINDFQTSDLYEQMKWGREYYQSKNTAIMDRRMLIYSEEEIDEIDPDTGENVKIPVEMDDPYKANNKLPSGYFKVLVDQKIAYLLSKPVTFEGNQAAEIEEILGRRFQIILQQVAKDASKQSRGWLHPYIDTDSQFQVTPIPAEQVIPIYGAVNHDIEKVIRFYKINLTEGGDKQEVTCVEVWTDTDVSYYRIFEGNTKLLTPEQMQELLGKPYPNPKAHFYRNKSYGGQVVESGAMSWGSVPFIPLYNNDEETYDLQPVKNFIDAYDIVNSDFVNNLEDFQDVYWILKGYGGENLKTFLNQVKRYKSLKVDEGGDARAEQIDIPFEARKEAKEGLEKDIFTFGMGVNPNAIGDGNITNVVIRSRFAMLDLKATQFENEILDFMYLLMDFVNKYREIFNQPPLEFEGVVFNKSIIVNELELLEANTKQVGVISERTRIGNHPWTDNLDEEIEAMEAERETVDLDDVVIDDEPE